MLLASSQACQAGPGGTGVLPDHRAARIARDRSTASDLAATLELLDGVEEARVHLALADRSLLARRSEARSEAAVVVVGRPGARLRAEVVKQVVAAAVAGLGEEDVHVVFTGPAARPETTPTVRVGPIEVVASSAGTARLVLGAALALCLLCAMGLIAAGLKLRRRRARPFVETR